MARGDSICQFMWSYQREFATFVRIEADGLLGPTGFAGHPKVMLVGFHVGEERSHPICIEPENGPYTPADLDKALERAAELYAEHPDRETFYTAAHIRADKQAELRDRMRAQALEELLGAHPASTGRTFFVGQSALVDGCEVHTVLSVDSAVLLQVPRIAGVEGWPRSGPASIIEAVIVELLDRAFRELHLPNAGHLVGGLGYGAPEIWQRALQDALRTAFSHAGQFGNDRAAEYLRSIASLLYEGRPGGGRLILAPREDPAVELVLRLQSPVALDNGRHVRKLLESSGPQFGLLMDHRSVYGLATITGREEPAGSRIFEIDLDRGGNWRFSQAGTALFSVQDGVPRLPVPTLDTERLVDTIIRILPGADLTILEPLAQAAARHSHGAMLIISSDAASEAARLAPQAARTEPARLTPELLTQLTNMDGGVLIDPQGECHAIGVILDGPANSNGDPSRGSRYNNAIRYLESGAPNAVVLGYSSDGDVAILPDLKPLEDRERIARLVERFTTASQTDSANLDDATDLNEELKSLSFYLSAEQCEQVNQARTQINKWRAANGEATHIELPLAPDPSMNDTYWNPIQGTS